MLFGVNNFLSLLFSILLKEVLLFGGPAQCVSKNRWFAVQERKRSNKPIKSRIFTSDHVRRE